MDASSVLGREPAMYVGSYRATTSKTRPVTNPADESTIIPVREANVGHVEQALEAAQRVHYDGSGSLAEGDPEGRMGNKNKCRL